jgi:hypothetical protein
MSFRAALVAETQKAPSRPDCRVGWLLANSPEAADIRAALESRDVSGSTITRALNATGVLISQTTIRRHRRGDCNCEQDAA